MNEFFDFNTGVLVNIKNHILASQNKSTSESIL